ncbi:hypothetical protein I79_019264 [Cricetulus griseus]|uniref:Uncharacterized protein n=1 Tax=Cricetulus griseus TaxID=10029 RepID=G3I6Y4_CRIGR|nr:hypothetical protein I79_019264 [Cricetulus griseus]
MAWDSTSASESRLCPGWASTNISHVRPCGVLWQPSGHSYRSPLSIAPQRQFNVCSKHFSLELCLNRPDFQADGPMLSQ